MENKKTISYIKRKKAKGEKIIALTAYDYPTALLLDRAGVDIILVGDSLGMVIQGEQTTLGVTIDHISYHTAIVSKAVKSALVVADMPYGSFHINQQETVGNAITLVKESKAEAVKIEGGAKRISMIKAIIDAEIPVMGHIGLTPQSVHAMSGYKVQGKKMDDIEKLMEEAKILEEAGCFSIVLEGVPLEVARLITAEIKIPTIGIGAGRFCDGQVLVFHDFLGMNPDISFKFVRKYANLASTITKSIQLFIRDVESGSFPSIDESFSLDKETQKNFEAKYGSHFEDK